MKIVIGDFLSNLINIEGPILRTCKHLFFKPGVMISSYINGNRKVYYKPFQYYILSATIYFLFFFLWGDDMLQMFNDLGTHYNTTATESQLSELQTKINKFQSENMKLFTFLQVPLYALFLWIFYRKKHAFSFTKCLVASLYIMAQSLIIGVLFTFLTYINPFIPIVANLVFILIYLPWTMKQLFDESIGLTILKSTSIIVIVFILYGILMSIISLVWVIYNMAPSAGASLFTH